MCIGGILCLRRADTRYTAGVDEMLLKYCGPDAFNDVFIITTMWDLATDRPPSRITHTERDPFSPIIAGGAADLHLRPNIRAGANTKHASWAAPLPEHAQDPWEIIDAVLSSMESRGGGLLPLLIQDELVNKNLPWEDTTAATDFLGIDGPPPAPQASSSRTSQTSTAAGLARQARAALGR